MAEAQYMQFPREASHLHPSSGKPIMAPRLAAHRAPMGPHEALYRKLHVSRPDMAIRGEARGFIEAQLSSFADVPAELPDTPEQLHAWMEQGVGEVTQHYEAYMADRSQGAPRRYFTNRAHALYFLRMVSPTKLVDGAWLAGLPAHSANPRLAPLIRTYLEELGDGLPDKNHVLLYRRLMDGVGLAQESPADDAAWTQGAIQLALGWNAEHFLPEIVGFNLGYEQLPLHLLITAYELDELGIDPYYFTLHVTVDNGASGHARQACDAVLGLLPRHGDAEAFWHRVREGSKLGCVGMSTLSAIESFDARTEVERILAAKAPMGAGAHSHHCRLAGRPVNDWLREPGGTGSFLDALESSGWVRRNAPPAESRFWQLLQGERAQMFGVFSPYELQVIHDWIRGEDSADGLHYLEQPSANQSRRRPRFRVANRGHIGGWPGSDASTLLDPDIDAFRKALAGSADPYPLLVGAMGPADHWSPVGLLATRTFAMLQQGGVLRM